MGCLQMRHTDAFWEYSSQDETPPPESQFEDSRDGVDSNSRGLKI